LHTNHTGAPVLHRVVLNDNMESALAAEWGKILQSQCPSIGTCKANIILTFENMLHFVKQRWQRHCAALLLIAPPQTSFPRVPLCALRLWCAWRWQGENSQKSAPWHMYDIKPPFYYFLEFVAFRVAASPSPRASSRDRNAAAQSLPAFDASLPTHTHTHTHTHTQYIYIYTHTHGKSQHTVTS